MVTGIVPLSTFRLMRRPCAFSDTLPGRSGRENLHLPLLAPVRIATVDTHFRIRANIREFVAGDVVNLRTYEPEVLVLPLSTAISYADQRLRGRLELPSLRVAIVVLSSIDDAPIADHHRDLLWEAFGLPVFEQLLGWDGRVIARECEVHDGLHFDASAVAAELDGGELIVMGMPTGLTAEIVGDHCECGAETPRLRHLNGRKVCAAAA
jgi:hypothetical protein